MANHLNAAKSKQTPSLLGGALIIAGTTVGAGMFSLPVVSAGMWFNYSLVVLLVMWAFMLISGLLLLETNLHFEPGASFDTLTKETLGPGWRLVNGLSIAFVLYILTYAYVSGGSSMVALSAEGLGLQIAQPLAGLIFGAVLAGVVFISTKAVDRITSIMLGAMIITFALSIGSMVGGVDTNILFNPDGNQSFSPYILAALPFALASFGYHGNVPSLVKYYGKEPKRVGYAIGLGTAIALVIYLLWQVAAMGNLPRSQFDEIIAQGGNMGVLVGALSDVLNNEWLSKSLQLFANLAVASSFLGVTLGLFDYIADLFSFDDSRNGRLKTAAVTFLPPILMGILFPNGFIFAIGFAALAATVWTLIVPALMARKSRQQFARSDFRVPGGNLVLGLVFALGILVAVCHLLAMANYLPTYPN
ncbi:tryptophan permease [Paraferrimonas sedimenticola]|uniref:Aromatic amino acid permease n=1 Tax=Paraferrimonas sedimenticola TaxID=375674 RepID=A0AA37RVY5_9GAMM|nr:tryptophan permease [Paraferrimonas sedimenticola]GLP95973.1 high affinity tryptophan transporter Mtr [Paraferrimonas sedimenticola]